MTQPAAQPWQRLAERRHAQELGVVAMSAPLRVITVLLAPSCVAAGGLQVPARIGANPDVFVGGRNRQPLDASDFRLIGQTAAAGSRVLEARGRANPADARVRVGYVDEPGGRGDERWRIVGTFRLGVIHVGKSTVARTLGLSAARPSACRRHDDTRLKAHDGRRHAQVPTV